MEMQRVLRLLYPPQCIGCDGLVATEAALCASCWRRTPFLNGLVCDRCGAPLRGEDGTAAGNSAGADVEYCDDCLSHPRPWDRGRAALLYRGVGRDIVLRLKHGDRTELAGPAGLWLAHAAQPLVSGETLIAPVPAHWRRMFLRRYNQAALIAQNVASELNLPWVPDLLQRVRATPDQGHRSYDARFANVEGAIVAHPRRRSQMAGRHVLIVDDVMTSGATLSAAAQAALAGGAGRVSVAVLARVAERV
ncbi:double zinc ribbon domain-containing protein [Candidatus Halocynthiibacter alkanivorans]|uniref:double zinc ribbon domain-containing protein n=1 Tax=Candidatus Halocynthiibacter alkanivorans TaxID=2267619 RepID=UPI000DF12BDA|nr:ComF family protein [Candidatus Halocynthiibacter alkanivorans]